jgi:hypothetical protein
VVDRLLIRFSSVRLLLSIWALTLTVAALALIVHDGATAVAQPPPAAHPAPATAPRSLTIAWTGDITPGSRYGLPPAAGRSLFTTTRPILRAADVTIGNLEGTFSTGSSSKCAPGAEQCFAFQAPPANAPALAWAGFDAVNLANNHANDYGATGEAETVTALDAAGVAHTGRPGEITVLRRHGITVALVGFAPYPWANDNRDLAGAQALVHDAAAQADVVVVLAHLGAEGSDQGHVPVGTESFAGEDRGDTRAFAHAVIDAGADAVLASGPHVLRGIERYRDRPIAYSLGNFAGFHNFASAGVLGQSAVLRLELSQTGDLLSGTLAALLLDSAGIPAPDAAGTAAQTISALGRTDFGAHALTAGPDGSIH